MLRIRTIATLLAVGLVLHPAPLGADEAPVVEDPSTRLLGLIEAGAAASQDGCAQECLSAFAEAIALADRLAADPLIAYPTLGVYVRAQLAETLRAHQQHADAEAAAWHALDLAVTLDDLASAAPAMRLVILSVIDQGADRAALADLVAELDLVLGPVEAYRLHVSPPPEPIAVMLEGMARELARAGEAELARESFAALVELDAARAATWRGSSDLGQLAWAALQAGDLRQAAWAQEIAEVEGLTVDLQANRAAIAFEQGVTWRSIRALDGAADRAEEQQDPYRQAVLLGRLAALHRHDGDPDAAVKHHRAAATLFEAMERPGDGALDRARGALALAIDGRFELALDELATATAPLAEGPRPPEVEDVIQRIDRLRVEADVLPRDEAEVLLARVERHLFETEQAEELLEVALLHVRWAVQDRGDMAAAVAAIEALQEQTGMGDDGWQAAWARGLAASGDERFAAWQEATRALEWTLAHPLPDDRVPGEPPPQVVDPLRLHRRLLAELTDAGRHAEALDVAERMRAVTRMTLTPPRHDPALDAVRLRMRDASFRGGERAPAEVRAELAGPLAELRAADDQAIDALPEGQRLLARVEGVGHWRPPDGTLALVCFSVGEQVHIVLVDGDGVTRVAEPDAKWLERQVRAWQDAPPLPKRRRDHRSGFDELGHLFGKNSGRLIEADRIVWVPAGPLALVPLAAVPLPDSRPIGDVAQVLTFPSLRAASLPASRPATGWLDVAPHTREAELALPEGVVASFGVPCLADGHPAAMALKLEASIEVGRATEPPPADGLLQPDEVVAAGWSPAAVVLPRCARAGAGGWTSAWLLAGAGAVIRPLWEPDPAVDAVFLARMRERIEAGDTVERAFASAQAKVRKRWKDPRDWANRVLAAPVGP